MYRIIKFKGTRGETLARLHTEEELAEYKKSNPFGSGPANGESLKKHCVVEFERGKNNCKMLAEFDTQEQAEKYYKTVNENYEPFGQFLVLAMELRPGGEYDDFKGKPFRQQKGRWSK